MKARWIIIDGYSLLHRDQTVPKVGTLAREQLIARLDAVGQALAERVTVVFDGAGFVGDRQEQAPTPVEVIFATAEQTADSVIERLAHEAARPQEILVVTSDRAERETVDSVGVATMGCTDFLHHLVTVENSLRRSATSLKKSAPKTLLGDFFPKH